MSQWTRLGLSLSETALETKQLGDFSLDQYTPFSVFLYQQQLEQPLGLAVARSAAPLPLVLSKSRPQ